MDISEISAQYLNSSYVPLSSSAAGAMTPAIQPGRDSAFEDLLKKTQGAALGKSASSAAPSVSQHSKEPPIDKTSKLYGLCLDLETFLIKNLIKGMRDTVQKSNLIDTGFAGNMYEDMLYDEYAKSYAKNANFGFAEMAYKELSARSPTNS